MFRFQFRSVYVIGVGALSLVFAGCVSPQAVPQVDPAMIATGEQGAPSQPGAEPSPSSALVVAVGNAESARPETLTVEAVPRLVPIDQKLEASLKSFGPLRQELTTFVVEMERLRAETANLNSRLKEADARAEAAQSSLARIEIELRAERLSRAEADQAALMLLEQLRAVARAVSTVGLNVEQLAGAAPPTARLETNVNRLRSEADGPVKYIVKLGDTLESIARSYYGDAGKWRAILEANRTRMPVDDTLKVGLEIELPRR